MENAHTYMGASLSVGVYVGVCVCLWVHYPVQVHRVDGCQRVHWGHAVT